MTRLNGPHPHPELLARWATLALGAALASLCACAPASALSVAKAPTAPAMPSPTATADPAICGAWSAADGATGQPVAARYGAILNCAREGDSWVIATDGLAGKPGVIGVDACHSDATCLNGQTARGMAAWMFYPAPYAGGVRLLGLASPGVLLVDDGGYQLRFTIDSGTYTP